MNPWFAAKALGGDVAGPGKILCPGPGHTAKDRSLAVTLDPAAPDDFLVHSFAGDGWQQCRDHVRTCCGLPQWVSREERTTQAKFAGREKRNREIEAASTRQIVARLWRDAVHPAGTLVARYLEGRGLFLPESIAGRVVRYHEHCPFRGEHGERVFQPAMLCRYSPIVHDHEPDAMPTAVHRTALQEDGSGNLGKQMLGAVLGQCVKLSHDEDVTLGLGIAEGVETGLAILQSGWVPIWACTTAGTLKTFPVLGGIEAPTIFADHDQTGLDAAQTCAERWQRAGREVFIRWTPKPGSDFADAVRP